ncbi:hypothetical protein FKM82_000512 [Ascaphus truei]
MCSFVIPKMAMSLPLFTYLQMYLIDLTELQYSTLMCALYILVRSGQYGTTHLLSTWMFLLPRIVIVAVYPPSVGARRRY